MGEAVARWSGWSAISVDAKKWIKGLVVAIPLIYFVAAFIMAGVATHRNYYNFSTEQYLNQARLPPFKLYRAFVGQPTKTRIAQAKTGDKSWFFLEAHKRDLRIIMLHGRHSYRLIIPHGRFAVSQGVRNALWFRGYNVREDQVAKRWTYSFGDLVKLHGQQLTANQPGIRQTGTWYDITHAGFGGFVNAYIQRVEITLKPRQYAAYLAHS